MKLRKVLALAAAAVMAVAALASCGVKEDSSNDSKAGGSSEKHYKIGIVQIMEHTSLNTIRDAVIDRLAELGYVDVVNTVVTGCHLKNHLSAFCCQVIRCCNCKRLGSLDDNRRRLSHNRS